MAELKQNILFVTTDGLYIHHELDLLKVEKADETVYKIPLHHLDGITILAHSNISPSLLNKCMKKGIFVSYLTPNGKFLGRLEGSNSGNVLLRKKQFKLSEDDSYKLNLAKNIVAGKIQNTRLNLLRTAREIENKNFESEIRNIAEEMSKNLERLEKAETMDSVRGYEGDSAKKYFSVFDHCIISQKEDFIFEKRTKRPPRSRINTLLSFAYSLVTNDCLSACQTVGLDPYIGFLHEERPGRPSLALDLVEEFRGFSDRFVITLINRKQIQASDITERTGSVYSLTDESRKKFLAAYQTRKQEEIHHHLLDQKSRIGELFILQARILARTIRGEIQTYQPYIWK